MALEYEAICMLADHRLAANATLGDVTSLLDTIFDVIVPVEVHYQWRPQLTDAGHEIVLEASVEIRLRTPAEVLKEIRRGQPEYPPFHFAYPFPFHFAYPFPFHFAYPFPFHFAYPFR